MLKKRKKKKEKYKNGVSVHKNSFWYHDFTETRGVQIQSSIDNLVNFPFHLVYV